MAPRGRNGGGGAGPMRAIALLVAVALVAAIAFGGGILVGRHWESAAAREAEPREPGAPTKKAAAARRAALGESESDRSREGGDKLTFYHTLAAPLSPPPSYPKPAADAKSKPGAPAATAAPAAGNGHGAAPAAPGGTAGSPAAPTAQTVPAPAAWTVQVGAFGNRQQADTLQQDLRRAGFEAYVAPLGTPDGQTRYRVRVGTFADRALAQRAADRLRAERSLPTFVATN